FALQNAPRGALRLGEASIEAEAVETGAAKFDLLLSVEEEGEGGLRCLLEYDAELFDEATAERMAGHYRTLLEAVAAEPDMPVAELPLLTAEEERLLAAWNRTEADYPSGACLHELFERQAAETPDAVALEYEGGQVSYAELNARANRLARHLRGLGVGPESRVGLCARRSPEMVAAVLAILKAGGAYVPLDPTYPQDRLAFMLEDTGAQVLLTEEALAGRFADAEARVVCLDVCGEAVGREGAENLGVSMSSECLAYVMYTSGSTGRPKGVCVTHRNVARLVKGTDYATFGAGEVLLQLASTSFDAATFELWGSLLNGARLVLMSTQTPTLEELGRALRHYGVTMLWLTAGLFHQMVDERVDDLRGLRQLLAGGDVLSVPHVRKLLEAPGRVRLINGYGPTESTTFACCHPVEDLGRIEASVPIGRPIANTTAYVLDARLRRVPVGVAGELYVGGDGLARGYLKRPGLTAERFIPHPFGDGPGARLYRTGDLARYLADGQIEFLGRADQQVKVRGFRVELGEIEAALRTHPSVRDCVVVTRAQSAGEDKRLFAYVVAEDGRQLSAGELREFIQKSLPEYMVPSAFVTLESLPLTPSGKVDRKALPDPGRPEASSEYEEPRTPAEGVVSALYCSLLGLERAGRADDFFSLGGHSLLATRLASRLREAFGVELPLRAIFEGATVAEVASRAEALAGTASARALPPVERAAMAGGHAPLSLAQERLWFLERLEPGTALYNMPVAVRLKGRLDVEALSRALAEVVRRHESLRTSFVEVDGRPSQVVSEDVRFELPLTDLSALDAGERDEEAGRLMADEARRPFDLAAGPLLRALLVRLAETEHVLAVVMHHIVSDGWSMGVLVEELGALYSSFMQGQESPLAELPVQYTDYALWQREHVEGEALDAQLAYWKRRLAGVPVLELPTDRPRPAARTHAGVSYSFAVPAEVADGLKGLGLREGVTSFMTLLAAFQVLLSRYAGQEDVAVGTPV
ncbi:MAG TPA: amino acid adenylation domain-containing protein, partial [Pyrinomonadaceae bacterium]